MVYRFALLCLLLNVASHANGKGEPVTVVELFTSQGCYSCPPADSFLGELKHQDNIIALSCHVTYWNYLGWRDTFSQPFCDQRQRRYQNYLKGNPGVYTPQMVINGRYAGVGSRKSTINRLIQALPKVRPIKLSFDKANNLSIHLPQADLSQQQLLLLGTSGQHRLPIARGENGGKQLTYHNPIEVIIPLGVWNGESSVLQHMIKQSEIKEWVVIAQDRPLGEITAAGKLSSH